jgi:hypothetical protein
MTLQSRLGVPPCTLYIFVAIDAKFSFWPGLLREVIINNLHTLVTLQ